MDAQDANDSFNTNSDYRLINVALPSSLPLHPISNIMSTSIPPISSSSQSSPSKSPISYYCSNAVYTTKYSLFTFIPKFLYEQFSKSANMFFLLVSTLQQVPGLTPTHRFATALPLSIIISISAIKESIEDLRRRAADVRANHSLARKLTFSPKENKKNDNTDMKEIENKQEGIETENRKNQKNLQMTWKEIMWEQVIVGDIIKVAKGETFPADMILLFSSSSASTNSNNENDMSKNGNDENDENLKSSSCQCFVETANIDGETNLKRKQQSNGNFSIQEIWKNSLAKVETPNEKIESFKGVLITENKEIPLGIDCLLLRGSTLRNTEWIQGLVVYTGNDTKMLRNAHQTPLKRSSLDRQVSKQIVLVFLLIMILTLLSVIMNALSFHYYTKKLSYLMILDAKRSFWNLLYSFGTFIILYHNLIPISLMVTMEVVKLRLAWTIENDIHMWDETTDTPATVRNSNLIEDLGRVKYLFTDKTGTLTRNQMRLDKVCDENGRDIEEGFMFKAMITCHQVIRDGKEFEGASPDEVAIVKGAMKYGYEFLGKSNDKMNNGNQNNIKIKTKSSNNNNDVNVSIEETLEILATIEFNSDRKRMSIIYRQIEGGKTERGKIYIITKGAESTVLPQCQIDNRKVIEDALESYSKEGLRTLVYAKGSIDGEEFDQWYIQWKAAITNIQDRQSAIDKAAMIVENNLKIIGVTGVEDRLQEGVPETIDLLLEAGIKIWVLTGDRLETAINIAFSCHLLEAGMSILKLINGDPSVLALLLKQDGSLDHFNAIVIDGITLAKILKDKALTDSFIKVSIMAETVIVCRSSPLQKALVVKMIKKSCQNEVCLAIGDGANDVSMIQTADLGVGISGKEGLQAVRSADFSISQFRFLQRLLLVHGSWSYHRISKTVEYCVYKNLALHACQFWYGSFSMFSGQTAFESWLLAMYNVVFTPFIPLLIGMTDQFLGARYLISNPILYKLLGQKGGFLNPDNFWRAFLNGAIQSFIGMIIVFLIVGSGWSDGMGGGPILSNGHSGGFFWTSTTLYGAMLVTVIIKAALMLNSWTWISAFILILSLLVWFVYLFLYDAISSLLKNPTFLMELHSLPMKLFREPVFWITILFVPIACLMSEFTWKAWKRIEMPEEKHIIQEIQNIEIKERRASRRRGGKMANIDNFTISQNNIDDA